MLNIHSTNLETCDSTTVLQNDPLGKDPCDWNSQLERGEGFLFCCLFFCRYSFFFFLPYFLFIYFCLYLLLVQTECINYILILFTIDNVLSIAVDIILGFSYCTINLAGYLMGKEQSFSISIQFSCTRSSPSPQL